MTKNNLYFHSNKHLVWFTKHILNRLLKLLMIITYERYYHLNVNLVRTENLVEFVPKLSLSLNKFENINEFMEILNLYQINETACFNYRLNATFLKFFQGAKLKVPRKVLFFKKIIKKSSRKVTNYFGHKNIYQNNKLFLVRSSKKTKVNITKKSLIRGKVYLGKINKL